MTISLRVVRNFATALSVLTVSVAAWPSGPALAGTPVCSGTLFPNSCSDGTCPGTQLCVSNGTTCACQTVACGDSAPTCNGACPTGQSCAQSAGGCQCEPLGCCDFPTLCLNETQTQCANSGGTFTANAFCNLIDNTCQLNPSPTPTTTATVTATSTTTATPSVTATATVTFTTTPSVTPTKTRVPNGGSCMLPSDCESLKCVDGTCAPNLSPAPATSANGLALGLAMLIALGGIGLWRGRSGTRF